MAYVFRRLPGEVGRRITLFATSSPSARCFDTVDAEDEFTRDVLEFFKAGKIFHADTEKVRRFQTERESRCWKTSFTHVTYVSWKHKPPVACAGESA